MSKNTITLVPVAAEGGKIVTSYGLGGRTVDERGRPLPRSSCRTVASFPPAPTFLATPGTARDLVVLADTVLREGGDFRLTEVSRDVAVQTVLRRKYLAWLAAGKPQPGTAGFKAATMHTTYVARPERSNHVWGGAIDFNVGALAFPEKGLVGNAALARLWDIADAFGFRPVIAHPLASASEAWHLDHLGPFRAVIKLFESHPETRGDGYGLAGEVANILAGRHTGDNQWWRYVQARLLAGGFYAGAPDGKFGTTTRAALRAAEIPIAATGAPDPVSLIGLLDEKRIGLDLIAAA